MTGNLQRRYTMQRLHIYPENELPKNILDNISNQIKQLRPVPVRLDHLPKEEVEEFPRLVKFPEQYVLR